MKIIPNSLKMIAVLTIAGLLAGGFLTFVHQKTAPEIEKKSLESLRKAIFVVLPQAVDYKELKLGDQVIYQGIDKRGRKSGIAFLAAGSGFQGEIKIMVGLEQDLDKIQSIRVLESVETPGLGGRITEDDFQQQFKGAATDIPAEVQAITGATISSKAVVDIINQKIARVKKMVEERK